MALPLPQWDDIQIDYSSSRSSHKEKRINEISSPKKSPYNNNRTYLMSGTLKSKDNNYSMKNLDAYLANRSNINPSNYRNNQAWDFDKYDKSSYNYNDRYESSHLYKSYHPPENENEYSESYYAPLPPPQKPSYTHLNQKPPQPYDNFHFHDVSNVYKDDRLENDSIKEILSNKHFDQDDSASIPTIRDSNNMHDPFPFHIIEKATQTTFINEPLTSTSSYASQSQSPSPFNPYLRSSLVTEPAALSINTVNPNEQDKFAIIKKEDVDNLESIHSKYLASLNRKIKDVLGTIKEISEDTSKAGDIRPESLDKLKSLTSTRPSSTSSGRMRQNGVSGGGGGAHTPPSNKKNINQLSLLDLAETDASYDFDNFQSLPSPTPNICEEIIQKFQSSISINEDKFYSLLAVMLTCFEGIFHTHEVVKKSYLHRIKSIQESMDVSGQKIYNSTRAEATAALVEFSKQTEEGRQMLIEQYEKKLRCAMEETDQRQLIIDDLIAGKVVYNSTGTNLLFQRDEAIRLSEEKKREAVVLELTQKHQEHLNKEIEIVRREMKELTLTHQKEIQQLQEANENKINLFAKSMEEEKILFSKEKESMQKEYDLLNEKFKNISINNNSDKKLLESQHELERDRFERELQQEKSESVKALSVCKAEIAAASYNHQIEMSNLRRELEELSMKSRNQLLESHAKETEHITELYKADLRRAQAQLELRHREETNSLKSMHEAEIRQVVRESERLKRLIARSGGLSELNYTTSSTSSSSSSSSCYHPMTHLASAAAAAAAASGGIGDSEPRPSAGPPAPTPVPKFFTPSSPSSSLSPSWDQLNVSIASQNNILNPNKLRNIKFSDENQKSLSSSLNNVITDSYSNQKTDSVVSDLKSDVSRHAKRFPFNLELLDDEIFELCKFSAKNSRDDNTEHDGELYTSLNDLKEYK